MQIYYGVAESGVNNHRTRYTTPDGVPDDLKNYYNTGIAAGAFTLIFGLIGIFTSLALLLGLLVPIVPQMNKLGVLSAHVPVLANVQWICLQAMLIICTLLYA